MLTEFQKGGAIVGLQAVAFHLRAGKIGSAVALGDCLLLAEKLAPLLRHLEEEQIGQLLNVLQVRESIVPENIAVAPELLD